MGQQKTRFFPQSESAGFVEVNCYRRIASCLGGHRRGATLHPFSLLLHVSEINSRSEPDPEYPKWIMIGSYSPGVVSILPMVAFIIQLCDAAALAGRTLVIVQLSEHIAGSL